LIHNDTREKHQLKINYYSLLLSSASIRWMIWVDQELFLLHYITTQIHSVRCCAIIKLMTHTFGIFWNKNIFRNIFQLFCSGGRIAGMAIQVFQNENGSQNKRLLALFRLLLLRIEHALSALWIIKLAITWHTLGVRNTKSKKLASPWRNKSSVSLHMPSEQFFLSLAVSSTSLDDKLWAEEEKK